LITQNRRNRISYESVSAEIYPRAEHPRVPFFNENQVCKMDSPAYEILATRFEKFLKYKYFQNSGSVLLISKTKSLAFRFSRKGQYAVMNPQQNQDFFSRQRLKAILFLKFHKWRLFMKSLSTSAGNKNNQIFCLFPLNRRIFLKKVL